MQTPIDPNSPEYAAWVEQQRVLATAVPTLFANRSVVTYGGGFVRLALGDQYGAESVYRAAFLMTVEDAEEIALLLWEQVQKAKQSGGGGNVQQPR